MSAIAVVGQCAPEDIRNNLEKRGYETVILPGFTKLPRALSSHADMLIYSKCGTLLTHEDYYRTAKAGIDRIAKAAGLEIQLTNEEITFEYPHDILFNAVNIGNNVMGKIAYVSKFIRRICEKNGLNFIDIKQGYAKCSVCVVNERSVITSDQGIEKKAREYGIECLRIRVGHISLEGYGYGFIGGCCGSYRDEIYFAGDVSLHPDYPSIKKFCEERGKKPVLLSRNGLVDIGSVYFFDKIS